jgi:glutamate formiminotransferase
MPTPLVECIPNFSEGRRLEVVDAIAQAVSATPGVLLLDRTSDEDHNRSVLTFVGDPQGIEDAAFAAIAKAAELIDMEQQRGEHPRIGATDVVPFVPISSVSMDDCVAIAKRLGKRVGEQLGIPVYLYEKAASRPERENLADLRKGQYEGLKAEIETDPQRKPDFGPSKLGSAGATVIGARVPLVAYNVFLDTDDVSIARKIAKRIRFSSGGLPYLKALGLLVEGQAQVSMNFTDYTRTGVHTVVDLIRQEAARYGAKVTRSELIGLIPQKAMIDAAAHYLQLSDFKPEQVLELAIQQAIAEASK